MSNSTNNSTNPDDQCASGDRLCEVRVYQVELIVVPTLLMGMFLIVLLGLCILRFRSKKPAPVPSSPTDIHFENHHTATHRHRDGHHQHHGDHHQHRGDHHQHHGDHHQHHRSTQNHHHHQHHGDHHQHHRSTQNHHPHHGGHHDQHHRSTQNHHHQQSQPHRQSHGHRHSQPHRSTHRRDRQHLQGIDAPPELNPLEHEVLPLRTSTPAAAPAVPHPPTEWQHGTFQVVRPLPLSFSVKADDVVTLYRARLDRRDVILRVLKETADATDRQAFQGFANFLSELGPHPFLPGLMGVVFSRTPLITAIEELENRDLLGFLWRCRQDHPTEGSACDITERHIFTMSGHIASALEYLHSKNCIHGNIGARSVLVGRDLTAKLWGLGPAYRRMSQPTTPGPLEDMELKKWQAPEALARRPVSENSDIWSFGILLYEMITLGDPPFPRVLANELLQHLQRGSTLKRPAHCSNSLHSIIKACCQWSPQSRASLAEVKRKLQSGERSANATTVLRVPEPLDIEKYMREAGYGESYNYAVL